MRYSALAESASSDRWDACAAAVARRRWSIGFAWTRRTPTPDRERPARREYLTTIAPVERRRGRPAAAGDSSASRPSRPSHGT